MTDLDLQTELVRCRQLLATALDTPPEGTYQQGAATALDIVTLRLRICGMEMQAEGWDARAYAGRELCAFADGLEEDARSQVVRGRNLYVEERPD